jgi:crossover junction endodeoxyribonuclease RuvC
MALIMGIDPGSHQMGYAVLKLEGAKWNYIESGILKSKLPSFNDRLAVLGRDLREVFLEFRPTVTVIERIFFGKNAQSAFMLGQIRGVCLSEAFQVGSEIAEYAAREVKKGVTGHGQASKDDVQRVLFSLLNLKGQLIADASDALALAYHHSGIFDNKRVQSETISKRDYGIKEKS